MFVEDLKQQHIRTGYKVPEQALVKLGLVSDSKVT